MIEKILNKIRFKTKRNKNPYPIDMESEFIEFYNLSKAYTMTSIERMYAAYKAVDYIESNNIEGDIVECGVWRGGSTMVMAYKLLKLNSTQRNLYLYDTFEGMSDPSEDDIDIGGVHSSQLLKKANKIEGNNIWCYASLDEVKKNIDSTGYPVNKINYIKGKVEETIPNKMPQKIAILRLDTDWYESTKHELINLFPLLSTNGIIIIDDYGHWKGSRKAVDEYFASHNIKIFLNRIDYTGRIGVKL